LGEDANDAGGCFDILLGGWLGCGKGLRHDEGANRVVGAWYVYDSAAPFHQHMYVFNAGGTMQQANPDAGDSRTSDSDGKGIWVVGGSGVKGMWVEITANRVTHQFVGRGEYSYEIAVDKDSFTGKATM